MTPILEIIKDSNLVLGTGHISIPEIYAVTRAARRMDIKVVITHPLCEVAGSALSLAQQQELVNMGAYLEHCLNLCMPLIQGLPPATIVEHVRAVGVEHCILSTDFGQDFNPAPPEGFRMMLGNMLLSGLSVKELETMVKTNPAQLLGLD